MARTKRAAATKATAKLTAAPPSEEDDSYDSAGDEPTEEDEADEEEYVKPAAKKARRSSAGGGGGGGKKKGLLKGILSLPLEILSMVCQNLDHPTLFHISRTNKAFYSFLRDSPAQMAIWDAARETSGLPEMTNFSSGCGKATTKVYYILRIRTCKACTPDFIISSRDWANDEYRAARDYAIRSDHQGCSFHAHFQSLRPNLRYLDVILDGRACHRLKRAAASGVDSEDESEVDSQNPDVSNDSEDDEDLDMEGHGDPFSFSQAYGGVSSLMRSTAPDFSATAARVENACDTEGAQVIGWVREQERKKRVALEDVRKQRRQDIEDRLMSSGWQRHHFNNPEWEAHALVNTVKELTDRTWASTKKQLETFLHAAESESNLAHIDAERNRRRQLIETEYFSLVVDVNAAKAVRLFPVPTLDEFMALPAVARLFAVAKLEETEMDDPSIVKNAEAISGDLEDLKTAAKKDVVTRLVAIFALIDQQRASADSSSTSTPSPLLSAPAGGSTYNDDEINEILRRAVAVVQCERCDQVDVFPRLLSHTCKAGYGELNNAPTFSSAGYDVDIRSVKAAMAVVEAAKKPLDTSAEAMDGLGPGFTCELEDCGHARSFALPWWLMIGHMLDWHWFDGTASLVYEEHEQILERLFKEHVDRAAFSGKRGSFE